MDTPGRSRPPGGSPVGRSRRLLAALCWPASLLFAGSLFLLLLSLTPGGASHGMRAAPAGVLLAVACAVWGASLTARWIGGRKRSVRLQLLLAPGWLLGAAWLAQTLAGHGLHARYFDNPSFQGEPFFRGLERTVSLDRVQERYHTFPQYHFSVRWEGWIRISRAGEHWFVTRSDDGSDLFLDDHVVVGNWGGSPVRWGKVDLRPGLHRFSVSYVQTGGPYDMAVYWLPPGEETEVPLPGRRLHPDPPAGWTRLAATRLLAGYLILVGLGGVPVLVVWIIHLRRAGRLRRAWRRAVAPGVALLLGLIPALVGAELAARLIESRRAAGMDPEEQLRLSEEMQVGGATGPLLTLAGLVRPSRYPDVVYELKPHLAGSFRNKPILTNSMGFRDREYPPRKPEGTFRIVGLGDSIMFGWGVAEQDCYLSVLEDRLNRAGGPLRFEVINMAVPGYNTALEAAAFERKAVELQPDLALVNFISNDFNLPNFMQAPRPLGSLGYLALPELLARTWDRISGRRVDPLVGMNLEDRFGATREEIESDETIPEAFRDMVGVPGFRRAMERFGRVARRERIQLVQAAQAFPDQLPVVRRESERNGFQFLNLAEQVSRAIERHGITDPRSFRVCAEDTHPNETAHRVTALVLERWLRQEGLVPLPPMEDLPWSDGEGS